MINPPGPRDGAAARLEDVLITEQLTRRRARPPEYRQENWALTVLAKELAGSSPNPLQKVSEVALELLQADSVGINILEAGGTHGVFRVHGLAGAFASNPRGTMPRQASPCGTVLELNEVQLFRDPVRFYPALAGMQPRIFEGLYAPWELNGQPIGTLWALAHHPERHFDSEDARLLHSLAHFASAAWNLVQRTREADEFRSQRSAALNLMEDAVLSRQALARSEERLRLIVENAREYAIYATDLQRNVTSWNPGAERILGYTAAEILGHTADVVFTAEDRDNGACEREALTALAEGRAADERWHVRKDGQRFWGSGVTMPMRSPAGGCIGFVKIFRDETEAKQTEEALQQSRADLQAALAAAEAARRQAEEANRAKDLFLATLSHELRTPLTPVLMAAEALLRQKNLPSRVQEALSMIVRNVQIESRLVEDLLDVTRIVRGKLELNRTACDVHKAVRYAAQIVDADFREKHQNVQLELAAPSFTLEGDFLRLQQAFWNLLKNASKFTPERGEIRVRSRNEGAHFVVEISDSGIGIDARVLPFIFDAFQQGDQAVAREFGGLGLGLAIARATVLAHGGSIIASSPGRDQGATFAVRLPLDSEAAPIS